MDGYITFDEATAGQAAALDALIPALGERLEALGAVGALDRPGPIMLGIGASLAAAAPAVWRLRSRGITSWRLGAGDTPLPLAYGDHPVVGISQSGRSTETIAALETVDRALRFAVVNAEPSPLAELAAHRIELGNIDDSYASTIGYTATVSALSMLAEAWSGGEVASDWLGLGSRLQEARQTLGAALDRATAAFEGASSADFVGAGPSSGSAEAGALLFREAARIPSTAMGTRQYLHGSMESAGDGVHVLFGDTREVSVARMLADAGNSVVLVTDLDEEPDGVATVRFPAGLGDTKPVFEALVLQELVRRVTASRGIDIEEFVFHNEDTKVDVSDSSR